MTADELRDLLTLVINRSSHSLDASTVTETGGKAVIGVEDKDSGAFFYVEITEA
ncbi:hypothetical protein [Streptomyces parvulus]|uniref:hypothetical protein n=1 Tax=Streptomyces parvulus TaxID=146923 RepID=UPI0015F08751|nr:hypothetical protein [Streptomyces parvulus]